MEKKGYAALQTGNFPLIKDRGTIDQKVNKKCQQQKRTLKDSGSRGRAIDSRVH